MRWFQTQRLKYFESKICQDQSCSTQDLMDAFGISRMTACKDTKTYLTAHPHNVYYQTIRRRYEATATFKPYYQGVEE